jgi:hypothetical protein
MARGTAMPAEHAAAIRRRVAHDGYCTCTLHQGREHFSYRDGTAIRDARKQLLTPAVFRSLGLIADQGDTLFALKGIPSQVWRARLPGDGQAPRK